MTSYLDGGWYGANPTKGLRTQVLDGAIDVAGSLHRASVSPEVVLRLALRVRLAAATAPDGRLEAPTRRSLQTRLVAGLGEAPALAELVRDCLRHVRTGSDLAAFYLHVVHVSRMMLVLTEARHAAAGALAKTVVAVPKARRKRAVVKKPARKRRS